MKFENYRIAVVIPAFKVKAHILKVISEIDPLVWKIYVVDDCCPEGSADFVKLNVNNPRVTVIRHDFNQGVGGAVLTGYEQAIQDGAELIVKIDGDGQMDPSLITKFIYPIISGEADYAKGNRFFNLDTIQSMPKSRLLGNAILSFMNKISSGYWNIFDPTNGYTAIHAEIAKMLPIKKISKRYFFETDMLFRLNLLRAVVTDIPMDAKYGDEVSNLKISQIVGEFFLKHIRNFLKRIFYNYFLRDLSLASIELLAGIVLFSAGACFGISSWISSANKGVNTPAGTVMLAALPILMGIQFILAFLGADIASVPRRPRQLEFNLKYSTKK